MTDPTTTTSADSLTVTCRCGAQAPRPEIGKPVTCQGCQFTICADSGPFADPGEIFYISPEHMAAIKDPRWTASDPRSDIRTETFYRATVVLWFPITDPASSMFGGSSEVRFECSHKHSTREASDRCGARLARAEVRRRNQQSAVERATEADGLDLLADIEQHAAKDSGQL
jgi:hypothetical protein